MAIAMQDDARGFINWANATGRSGLRANRGRVNEEEDSDEAGESKETRMEHGVSSVYPETNHGSVYSRSRLSGKAGIGQRKDKRPSAGKGRPLAVNGLRQCAASFLLR